MIFKPNDYVVFIHDGRFGQIFIVDKSDNTYLIKTTDKTPEWAYSGEVRPASTEEIILWKLEN